MNFNGKTAREIQDEIFGQMPAEKKPQLTYDFSSFLTELNKLGDPNDRRISEALKKNRRDSGK